jgi:hypothetical protein
VIVADADLVASVTDVAVSVTVAGLGIAAGPVKVIAAPEALVVADKVPHPLAVAHDIAHVTPFTAVSFVTVAAKLCVALVASEAVVGDTDTAIVSVGVVPPPPPVPVLAFPPHPAKNAIPPIATIPANKLL